MHFRQLGGGDPKVITTKAGYRELVKNHIMTDSGGFTHLYSAVREGMTDLLTQKRVRSFISNRNAQPTFIVLKDGFNKD